MCMLHGCSRVVCRYVAFFVRCRVVVGTVGQLAERSKAPVEDTGPKGRGFESHIGQRLRSSKPCCIHCDIVPSTCGRLNSMVQSIVLDNPA